MATTKPKQVKVDYEQTWDRHVKIAPALMDIWFKAGSLAAGCQKLTPHTQPPTCRSMSQICWHGSEVRAGFGTRALRVFGSAWLLNCVCVCVCVVTFPCCCQRSLLPPELSPPLWHDLSLYSNRAASAERAARLRGRLSLHTSHIPFTKSTEDKLLMQLTFTTFPLWSRNIKRFCFFPWC